MSTPDETWAARLHAAIDADPRAVDFDVRSYVDTGRRARRIRLVAATASVAAAALVAAIAMWAALGPRQRDALPAAPGVPRVPAEMNGTQGRVAYQSTVDGGSIRVTRPGGQALDIQRNGVDGVTASCPAWSPDGRRLMYGLVRADEGTAPDVAELAIAPQEVSQDGKLIRLDGFTRLPGFDQHPCAVWAPDGRWVALAATNEVWVVDTEEGAIRKLPGFRPSDLEWRPGTDELAFAGDQGMNRDAPTTSTPITVYSVSTGRFREIDSVDAAHITWSPDGATLAYVGGEDQVPQLRIIDADGSGPRVLRSEIGTANHGIGPVWSPTGERIAYQRLILGVSGERHEVVLVDAADGSETVIGPPEVGGRTWYPHSVAWSPDGETLVYVAWSGSDTARALLAVPVDDPGSATVLDDDQVALSDVYSSGWTFVQMWGRQS